jgi:NTE family protein
VREFVRINDLVRQGQEAGLELKKPNGQPYRYCPITLIEPAQSLGDTLDFSQTAIQERLRHGEETARTLLRAASERPAERYPPIPGPEPLHS